jgi:Icc-related predicted phosphoesterase
MSGKAASAVAQRAVDHKSTKPADILMQKYRLASDFHSELWPEQLVRAVARTDRLVPILPGDADTILLLAGDTGSYRRRNVYKAVADRLCDRFLKVFDVPGNHFWYGGTDWTLETLPFDRPNYHFGSTISLGNIKAATLWTDFGNSNPAVEKACYEGMNDFGQIPDLEPEMIKSRHADHVQFLRDNIQPGDLVMTHFAPSLRSLAPEDLVDPLSGYFATDLESLILEKRPAVWVHGHIHTPSNYTVGETKIICNPAGYQGRDHNPTLAFTA